MSDANWERVQKEREERIKRLEEENWRKAKGAELAQKEEDQNKEFKKAALKRIAETGSTDGLFYKEKPKFKIGGGSSESGKPTEKLQRTANSIKKEFGGEDESLLDKIRRKMGIK